LRGTGNGLIVGGTVGDRTEATGEFIANISGASGFWANLMKRNHSRLPSRRSFKLCFQTQRANEIGSLWDGEDGAAIACQQIERVAASHRNGNL
jgi:hypothetical protein